ncbi:MAG: DUF3800 domain-containing protein [Acidobacteria bacterium]|nr:DUF3800 domain-containing protein [Acidobacteriota bacterium]
MPIEERYELIDLMVQIFEKFQLPIVFQTCSPEFLSEIRPKIGVLPKIDFLDLDKPDHFALFVLLLQVRRFMADHRQYFGRALPVIIDEGLVKSGVVVELPHWADSFRKGRVEFRKSHECAFLQLADFAAFAISRTQWLLAKGNLKRHDVRFLEIVSNERLCVINLPSAPISLDNHTAANYDRYMKRDRRAKGLPDDPPSG